MNEGRKAEKAYLVNQEGTKERRTLLLSAELVRQQNLPMRAYAGI
jgi:hypothetical protein